MLVARKLFAGLVVREQLVGVNIVGAPVIGSTRVVVPLVAGLAVSGGRLVGSEEVADNWQVGFDWSLVRGLLTCRKQSLILHSSKLNNHYRRLTKQNVFLVNVMRILDNYFFYQRKALFEKNIAVTGSV